MAQEIGRKIAYELSNDFVKLGLDTLAQQSKHKFANEVFASLLSAITAELRGFNEVVPREFRLTMLAGQNCLIFSFKTKLALTLKVDLAHVRLLLTGANEANLAIEESRGSDGRPSIEFTVTRDGNRFTYQRVPFPPAVSHRSLSQSEFIEGAIRAACGQPFERP